MLLLLLLLLFMAVTSSTSAELIAVSSLLTFHAYKTYYCQAQSYVDQAGSGSHVLGSCCTLF